LTKNVFFDIAAVINSAFDPAYFFRIKLN